MRTQADARSRRGAVLVLVAIALAMMFSITVVAVDIGRLAHSATEVQTIAEVAASAGVTNLLHGGTAATARAEARTVVAQNSVAGAPATIADGEIDVGQYDPQTNTFTNGAAPPNAVRARPSATVQNLVAGYFGASFRNTTLTKSATAAFAGLGQAAPSLPLVIGDCDFAALQACFGNPSCLPRLSQVPNTTNNTAWTSFFMPSPNKSSIEAYFPSACGGSLPPPVLHVGDQINLSNGQITPLLTDLQQCFQANVRQFLAPIVSCAGNFNQSSNVVGFATIVVDSVVTSGDSKGVNLHAIFQQASGPPGGCTNCGSGLVTLVN